MGEGVAHGPAGEAVKRAALAFDESGEDTRSGGDGDADYCSGSTGVDTTDGACETTLGIP